MKKIADYSAWMELWEREYTLTRQLYRNVLRWGSKEAIIDPKNNKTLTFKELDEESNRFAHALLDLGAKPFDVVMGNVMDTYHWFTIFMGSMKARCIFSSVNTRLPEGQLCHLMDDSEPRVFVYDPEVKDTSVKTAELAEKKPKLCIMLGKDDIHDGHMTYEEFIKGKSIASPVTEKSVRWVDPCLILYTSGTTGLPKGFPINQAMIFFDNMMNAALEKLDSSSVNLATNPLFHRGGNTTGVLPCLHAGGTVVTMKHFSEELALDYVEKYKVTHMVSAPTVYERMCILQEQKPRDVSSLQRGCITSMGAPLDKEACLKMMKLLTPNVMNGYGTADGHWVTMLRPYELPEGAGTIGLAVPEDIVKLVKVYPDRRGNPENPDDLCPMDGETEGEIALRTIHCPYQYINRPEDTAKAFPYRGWQLPGDVATWDKDGYITVQGRTDDMIISGGENIHPVIVEEVLKEHRGVLEAFVTGIPSQEWGQAVVAYVTRKDPTITEKDLDEFCKSHPGLARYQRPRYYKFVELKELPFNPAGKKMHYTIKERAAKDFPNLP